MACFYRSSYLKKLIIRTQFKFSSISRRFRTHKVLSKISQLCFPNSTFLTYGFNGICSNFALFIVGILCQYFEVTRPRKIGGEPPSGSFTWKSREIFFKNAISVEVSVLAISVFLNFIEVSVPISVLHESKNFVELHQNYALFFILFFHYFGNFQSQRSAGDSKGIFPEFKK